MRNIQEMFGDYLAMHKHLFSVNTSPCLATVSSWDKSALQRTREVCLASPSLPLLCSTAASIANSDAPALVHTPRASCLCCCR